MSDKLFKIPNKWGSTCFGCSERGLNMNFWMTHKGCYTEYYLPDGFTGFRDIAHGGIVSTMLDEISAWTVISHKLTTGLTIELSTKYLKPVPTNTLLRIESEITSDEDKKLEVYAKISNEEGKILAESNSQWYIPELDTLAKIVGNDVESIRHQNDEAINPIRKLREQYDLI